MNLINWLTISSWARLSVFPFSSNILWWNAVSSRLRRAISACFYLSSGARAAFGGPHTIYRSAAASWKNALKNFQNFRLFFFLIQPR